jgi:hypothetical protein
MWYVPELGGLVGNWVLLLPLLNCKLAHAFFGLHTVLLCMFSAKFGQKCWSKKEARNFLFLAFISCDAKNFLCAARIWAAVHRAILWDTCLCRAYSQELCCSSASMWGTRVLQEALCVALETWWLLSKKKRNLSNAYSFCMDMEQDTGSGCQRIASQYHVSMHVSYEPDLCHLCSLTACAPKMKNRGTVEVAGDRPLLTAAASLAGKISGACNEEASCWRFFLCSPRQKLLGPSLLLCVEKADPGFPDRKRLPRSSKKAFQAMSILSSRTLCPFYLLTLSCPPELKFHWAAKRHCCHLFFSWSILLLFSSRCLELTCAHNLMERKLK